MDEQRKPSKFADYEEEIDEMQLIKEDEEFDLLTEFLD